MAQAPQQPAGNGAAQFVRHIVADPKNVPDVMLLSGYLGVSSEEGHERLYLSPDLTNYVEIPRAAILHQAPLPKEQDAHGGVTLWVKKDAALQYKMAPAAQALANYFAGAIQAGAQGAAPAAPQPTPPLTIRGCTVAPALCPVTVVGPACTQGNTCGIDCSVVCPTQHVTCLAGCGVDSFVLCPTHRLPCPTQHVTCPAGCGVDSFVLCPTHRLPCPTQHVTCPAGCGVDSFVLCPTHRLPCPTHPPQATCLPNCTQRTPCPGVSCGVDCTVIGPACQSVHVGTCFPQCRPTRFDPECPFPTEVTCVPVCAASPAPACGPNTIGGCSAGCFPGQPGPVQQAAFAGQANIRPSFVDCTFRCTVFGPGCQSHFHTCAPCVTQHRTPCPAVSCGIDCTVFGPGCSRFHTCAPCVTQHRTPCPGVSCGIDCTVVGPACQSVHVGTCILQCGQTRFEPQCAFPTEVTCVPVCAASPAPACGPNVTIGGCSAGCFPGQPGFGGR